MPGNGPVRKELSLAPDLQAAHRAEKQQHQGQSADGFFSPFPLFAFAMPSNIFCLYKTRKLIRGVFIKRWGMWGS
jgi:hypothetical protein